MLRVPAIVPLLRSEAGPDRRESTAAHHSEKLVGFPGPGMKPGKYGDRLRVAVNKSPTGCRILSANLA